MTITPSPTPLNSTDQKEIDALQATLAAEHAAVYVYGVLGGQTSASEQPTLMRQITDAFSTHRLRRDHLTAVLAEAGQEPVGSEPGYQVPPRLGTPEAVRKTARGVEQDCTTSYAALVAATEGHLRSWSVTALSDAAVRAVSFGASPTPFPGID